MWQFQIMAWPCRLAKNSGWSNTFSFTDSLLIFLFRLPVHLLIRRMLKLNDLQRQVSCSIARFFRRQSIQVISPSSSARLRSTSSLMASLAFAISTSTSLILSIDSESNLKLVTTTVHRGDSLAASKLAESPGSLWEVCTPEKSLACLRQPLSSPGSLSRVFWGEGSATRESGSVRAPFITALGMKRQHYSIPNLATKKKMNREEQKEEKNLSLYENAQWSIGRFGRPARIDPFFRLIWQLQALI